MRVDAVGALRTRLELSRPNERCHGRRLTVYAERTKALLIAGLALVAVLMASAMAQGGPPGSASAASISAQPPASARAAGATASSQDSTSSRQPQAETEEFVFKKKVEEVALHAVVVDQQNHLISSLNRDAFSVYEDGKLQKLTSFRQENVPLAMGILIDNSGSMRPKRQKVNEAALNLVRSSSTQDQVFVVNFGEQSYLDQDFTDDVRSE